MAEKIITVKVDKKELNIKCKETSGYDGHTYTIIYDNDDGRYIGEMQDINCRDSDFTNKLKKFLKLNY